MIRSNYRPATSENLKGNNSFLLGIIYNNELIWSRNTFLNTFPRSIQTLKYYFYVFMRVINAIGIPFPKFDAVGILWQISVELLKKVLLNDTTDIIELETRWGGGINKLFLPRNCHK